MSSTNVRIEDVLKERGAVHGPWKVQAYLSSELKDVARQSPGWDKLTPSQQECVDMILHKLSRILVGNPNEKDHWLDIAGYATLEIK